MEMTMKDLQLRSQELYGKMMDINAKEMTDEQKAEFDKLQREYVAVNNKIQAEKADVEYRAAQAQMPKVQKTLMAELREAIKNNRTVTVNGYTPEGGSAVAGVHGDVIETEMQGILDPLYTNSVLSQLGVRFYPGLPQGDVQIPIMSKNTVGWADEIAAASASQPGFTHKTLQPKRLTAYVDISKELIMQDTVGVEAAIRRDLAKAIQDKLEATIFGYGASSTTTPAGMFNGITLEDAKNFVNLVKVEGELEDACVNPANCKYLLSPKAKATLRTMATNGNGSPRVLTSGEIDGTPAFVSGNVVDSAATTKGAYIYGDFSNLAVGSWGNVEIRPFEDSRTAVDGVIRLVVNAYFDAKILRTEAFKYGDVRHA